MTKGVDFILRYRLEGETWNEFILAETETIIGRGEDCTLVLPHTLISRHHASLRRDEDKLWLTDLGSTNGTNLAGTPLTAHKPYPLLVGQSFTIGSYTLEILPQSPAIETHPPISPEGHAYQLRVSFRDIPAQVYPLVEGELILGRWTDCNLILDDPQVSRHHAQVKLEQGNLWLTDLGSTNGTQLEGKPLSPRRQTKFQLGQVFSIGDHLLSVEMISPVQQQAGADKLTPSGTIMFPHQQIPTAGDAGVSGTILGKAELQLPVRVQQLQLSSQEKVSFGRASDNDIVLNHAMVSLYHASIERLGTRYRLLDLRSTNGVFVNGKRIDRQMWLKEQDEIRIGPYGFRFSGDILQQQDESGLHLEAVNINQRVSRSLNLLQNLCLHIKPMEFVALVGMSGSGKTTLLNALSGYKPASHGQVRVNGVDLYAHYNLFRNDIGYVPQRDIVHAELTPESALGYVAQLRMPPDTSQSERQNLVAQVLADLDLSERRDVTISQLSGGQIKRVSIGVELLTKPRLFFLDEPTSGLDPGTEYEMMKLLRKLADQGRTVILVTHATKNVMLCDKVVFLARGGNLAYFGSPEEALAYFDTYRTPREQREKEMEFDDIYRILSDETRCSSAGWAKRYKSSNAYAKYCLTDASRTPTTPIAEPLGEQALVKIAHPPANRRQAAMAHTSAFRQFRILSARNLKILTQDKVSLLLMLALAPAIGFLDFIWGPNLFDPSSGDFMKIVSMWFMLGVVTLLVGSLSSIREIVKEVDIYKRERAINLKILPYILSKVWIGVVLALYQSVVLLLFKLYYVKPDMPSSGAFLALYVSIFLGIICGYLLGLAISASAPNQNAAMILIIAALVPNFLFSGALLSLDLIPGGKQIGVIMPSRWLLESFLRITGMGNKLNEDPCWVYTKEERLNLPASLKANCPCSGVNIFTQCSNFPGILSPDQYPASAQTAIAQSQPIEPAQPTAIPFPTAAASPTPLLTPTRLPSPTPHPTPLDPREMTGYLDRQREQAEEYQDEILNQFEDYRLAMVEQGKEYSQVRSAQGDEYSRLRQAQADVYKEDMRKYTDERADWQKDREKAIGSAEELLDRFYDKYGHAIRGSVTGRWLYLSVIMSGLLVAIVLFQKRKDVV